ncbi:MAG: NeuD/PglB/VioB family sugar acetyltransferase [Gaiella sp.]|nr:NeuD/PglB/VioB family sugar acetyltransferase [Gaiella sp.]
MSEPTPLLVLGTREISAEIADVATQAGYRVEGFVENLDRERCDATLAGLPIRWIDDVAALADTHLAVLGIGTTRRWLFAEQAAGLGFRFATVVHPSANVSPTTSVGAGSIVSAGVSIGAHTTIGRHVFLNRGCLVGHHSVLDDYVTVSPGAIVSGLCHVGTSAFVATGAVVIDRVSIGERSVVGAGAVVTRDVPERVQVLGVPAKVVKEGVEGR